MNPFFVTLVIELLGLRILERDRTRCAVELRQTELVREHVVLVVRRQRHAHETSTELARHVLFRDGDAKSRRVFEEQPALNQTFEDELPNRLALRILFDVPRRDEAEGSEEVGLRHDAASLALYRARRFHSFGARTL